MPSTPIMPTIPPPLLRRLLRRLPFSRSTTPLQAATYLLGVALFSIAFLVFLNSSISFVITDRIGIKTGVGSLVGTLGFVDELVALVACPAWGLVSDRLGVRLVAVLGYAVLALALVLSVQATNVYPQLLLARMLFAVGATAAATMVTAILPSLAEGEDEGASAPKAVARSARSSRVFSGSVPRGTPRNPRDSALSIESQLTITPERFAESLRARAASGGGTASKDASGRPSQLAGLVGLFTGCGALVALVLFLPLPAAFARRAGVSMADAVARSFYVVAAVALLVAAFVSVGLRGLRGEQGKGWKLLWSSSSTTSSASASAPASAYRRLRDAVRLGFADADIGLGYLGGFVARASTVAISLFVPLFVNAFFIGHGFCQGAAPNDPSPALKKECRAAYVLAAILTGVAQLTGLLCAPVFGYVAGQAGRTSRGRRPLNWPILVSTALGVAGYVAFPQLASPEYANVDGRGGSPAVFVVAALLGISQIGAIVCSLGALGKGVLGGPGEEEAATERSVPNAAEDAQEATLLLQTGEEDEESEACASAAPAAQPTATATNPRRLHLKGSIAGVYSWCGGAAILLLTKLGGYLFDHWTRGAPFYLMAGFNGLLLAASLGVDAARFVKARKR